ncbi:MAG: hypothetical protein IJM62_08005 [Lachnospiraceae bacterium]|nr:hypothetical protein [Lachnospiraceae bacterium]
MLGMDEFFAAFLAFKIMEGRETKKNNKRIQKRKAPSAAGERSFIRAADKHLYEDRETPDHALLTSGCEIPADSVYSALDPEERTFVSAFYRKIQEEPSSCAYRCGLITWLWNRWKEKDRRELINVINNELAFIIDSPSGGIYNPMYRHLAMFLSSECCFFTGEFDNSLKRLYQALDWDEIYENLEDPDGIDMNGLMQFHEAALVNIISIYALAGLPEKADAVRRNCSAAISSFNRMYDELITRCAGKTSFIDHLMNSRAALFASRKMLGYYTYQAPKDSKNLFSDSFTSLENGMACYNIDFLITEEKDIRILEKPEDHADPESIYPRLKLGYHGCIDGYMQALDRCRERIRSI